MRERLRFFIEFVMITTLCEVIMTNSIKKRSLSRILTILLVVLIFALPLSACDDAPDSAVLHTDAEPTPQPTPAPTPAPEPAADEPTVDEPGPNQAAGYAFPFTFTGTDLYGNTVTEESLGEPQIFFVHYWATWCPPCVNEMPDLAKLAKEYEGRVGFIALLDDYSSNLSGAKRITDSAGMPSSFIMVDANTSGLGTLLSMVQSGYVPTTVIIGGDGRMLGDQLIGSLGGGYAAYLDKYLPD